MKASLCITALQVACTQTVLTYKMSEISKILGDLPDGEETRERVAEWLKRSETGQGSEEDNSDGPLEGGQHDSPGESRGKNSKTVSLFQSRAGE